MIVFPRRLYSFSWYATRQDPSTDTLGTENPTWIPTDNCSHHLDLVQTEPRRAAPDNSVTGHAAAVAAATSTAAARSRQRANCEEVPGKSKK